MDNFNEIPIVEQPQNFKTKLYRHQLANIYTMEKMETNKMVDVEGNYKETSIGFLSSDTGTGKTATVIGMIVRDQMIWDINIPFVHDICTTFSGGRIKFHKKNFMTKLNCSLIVMSSTILHQWKSELAQTNLKVGYVFSNKTVESVDPNEFDVILVIATMYNKFIKQFYGKVWKRFIFDEPSHIRVPAMKPIQAGFYWFITATPHSIVSQHSKCKTFMNEIIATDNINDFSFIFNGLIIKNDPEFVKQSFNIPPTTYMIHECFQPLSNIVQGFVSNTIRTMIEAGNIGGAILALGGNETSNVVELIQRKKQEELEIIESRIRIYMIRQDENRVREWTNRKNRINSQLLEIEKRLETSLQSDCLICASKLSSPVLEYNCQNLFCGSCLFEWLKKNTSCPICRRRINPSSLVYIKTQTNEEIKKTKRPPTKLEIIIDIINKKPNGHFIIFSEYDHSFDPICNFLQENDISFVHLKGSMNKKEKSINNYKNGLHRVMCLNSMYDGSGLNLQETTDIILYHQMPDSNRQQIIGRANRIGRKIPLTVHQLVIQSY
jgi:SNF2 family DNA or RNA helicase